MAIWDTHLLTKEFQDSEMLGSQLSNRSYSALINENWYGELNRAPLATA